MMSLFLYMLSIVQYMMSSFILCYPFSLYDLIISLYAVRYSLCIVIVLYAVHSPLYDVNMFVCVVHYIV